MPSALAICGGQLFGIDGAHMLFSAHSLSRAHSIGVVRAVQDEVQQTLLYGLQEAPDANLQSDVQHLSGVADDEPRYGASGSQSSSFWIIPSPHVRIEANTISDMHRKQSTGKGILSTALRKDDLSK